MSFRNKVTFYTYGRWSKSSSSISKTPKVLSIPVASVPSLKNSSLGFLQPTPYLIKKDVKSSVMMSENKITCKIRKIFVKFKFFHSKCCVPFRFSKVLFILTGNRIGGNDFSSLSSFFKKMLPFESFLPFFYIF